MTLEKLSAHVYYLPFSQTADRPNIGYINGSRFSLRIDAGNSPAHNACFTKAREAAGLREESICVITHWHWDHTFGMHSLTCPSLCSRLTQERLNIVKRWKWTPEAMAERLHSGEEIEFCDTNIRLEYPDLNQIKVTNADHTLDGELRIDLGDVHVRCITTDSPHSKDALIVLVEEDRTLFVADADCEDFYHGAVYVKERLELFIHLIESLDFDTYIVGHAFPETKQEALNRLYNTLALQTE